MTFRASIPILLALGLASAPPGSALAGDGAEIFRLHCAACHGASAEGNGPMAAVLTLQPADLTSLAARNGGAFPLARVVARIDGTDPLVAHGSPMPVYGPLFGAPRVSLTDKDGQVLRTSRPIRDLVEYLTTIQD